MPRNPHTDAKLALAWVDQVSAEMRDVSCPPEIRQLGRTLRGWRTQIAAWHEAQVTNGPTETMITMNGLAKRIKRVAFGSGLPTSAIGESECCSTPASPTGPSSPPSPA
jgi:transposase